MLARFLQLLGISPEITDHLEHASLAVQRSVVLWVGLLLLVPIGYWMLRRQRSNLVSAPRGLHILLTACRLTILAILVLVLSGPYLRIDHRYEKRPLVAVVIDHSQSMQLPAGPFDSDASAGAAGRAAGLASKDRPIDAESRTALNQMSRARLAHAILEAASPEFIVPLAERFDLKVYGAGTELTPISVSTDSFSLPDPPAPGHRRSGLADGITAIIDQTAGRPIAGIVLLSDGQNTGNRTLSQAAQAASEAGTPVFTVPIGPPERLRDVAIVDVFTSGQVSVGDTATVSVTIESNGFDGRSVRVALTESDTPLAAKDLTLRGSEQQHIELSFEAKEPGARYLSVSVTEQDEETVRANNHDMAYLRVDDERIKVLYLEGLPRWDFRFIKNGMHRDHGLDAVVLVESELRLHVPEGVRVPDTVQDWSAYRTVLLGDCSPELLTADRLDSLGQAVREHGVGLVVLAGSTQMPHAHEGSALVDLLPVRVRRGVAGYDAAAFNPFKMQITPAGAVHEALRLYDEPSHNAAVWAAMTPYHWCAAVVRPAPGATVLATNPSIEDRFGAMPLIAYHHAGRGKVMFVGTDSTWLWRQNVGDRFFYKFWGQTIRFVAQRDDEAGKNSWMEVRPLRPQVGEEATVELMAFDANGSPRQEAAVTVAVSGPEPLAALELDRDPTVPGRYTGSITPRTEGIYTLRFSGASDGESAEAEMRVAIAAEELRRPHVDRPALEILASRTGGRSVELGGLPSIPPELEGEPKLIEMHREESIWDNWFTLALLVLVYSIDVGLRRLSGLS